MLLRDNIKQEAGVFNSYLPNGPHTLTRFLWVIEYLVASGMYVLVSCFSHTHTQLWLCTALEALMAKHADTHLTCALNLPPLTCTLCTSSWTTILMTVSHRCCVIQPCLRTSGVVWGLHFGACLIFLKI